MQEKGLKRKEVRTREKEKKRKKEEKEKRKREKIEKEMIKRLARHFVARCGMKV